MVWSGIQVALERLPLDKTHHQVPATLCAEVVVNGGEAGVLETGEEVGLLLKLLDGLGDIARGKPAHAHFLDGDEAIAQLGILGKIDRAHAAFPYDAQEAIALVQQLSCGQSAGPELRGWKLVGGRVIGERLGCATCRAELAIW